MVIQSNSVLSNTGSHDADDLADSACRTLEKVLQKKEHKVRQGSGFDFLSPELPADVQWIS